MPARTARWRQDRRLPGRSGRASSKNYKRADNSKGSAWLATAARTRFRAARLSARAARSALALIGADGAGAGLRSPLRDAATGESRDTRATGRSGSRSTLQPSSSSCLTGARGARISIGPFTAFLRAFSGMSGKRSPLSVRTTWSGARSAPDPTVEADTSSPMTKKLSATTTPKLTDNILRIAPHGLLLPRSLSPLVALRVVRSTPPGANFRRRHSGGGRSVRDRAGGREGSTPRQHLRMSTAGCPEWEAVADVCRFGGRGNEILRTALSWRPAAHHPLPVLGR